MSLYIELYSDYLDAIKAYNQEFSVTPLSFMRHLSRGMQIFQRETEYIERKTQLQWDEDLKGYPLIPEIGRIIEVMDYQGITLVSNDYLQWKRNIQTESIQNNTPGFYNLRNPSDKGARLYTVISNVIKLFPKSDLDTLVNVVYVFHLPVISGQETYWADFFPTADNLENALNTRSMPVELIQYEGGILDYAISRYLLSVNSPMYKVYEDSFLNEIVRAKQNKPTYISEAVADYNMSPYIGGTYER